MEELIKEALKQNGMQRNKIDGYFMGIDLIKVKTSYKKFSNLITICISGARLSKGVDDWYITDVYNLGGRNG